MNSWDEDRYRRILVQRARDAGMSIEEMAALPDDAFASWPNFGRQRIYALRRLYPVGPRNKALEQMFRRYATEDMRDELIRRGVLRDV